MTILDIRGLTSCLRRVDTKRLSIENGGEFVFLSSDYDHTNLAYIKTCLHTYEQNDGVKSWLKRVIKIGLTFMLESGMPLKFWW